MQLFARAARSIIQMSKKQMSNSDPNVLRDILENRRLLVYDPYSARQYLYFILEDKTSFPSFPSAAQRTSVLYLPILRGLNRQKKTVKYTRFFDFILKALGQTACQKPSKALGKMVSVFSGFSRYRVLKSQKHSTGVVEWRRWATTPLALTNRPKNGRVFLLKTLDARLNLEYPLLLCKGLAKTKGLQWKGRRSVLGQVLGRRNSPWLDGTAPGLAIALSGSNTDVRINDLLPSH